MNYRSIANVFGVLLVVTGCSMLLPVICSLLYGEDDLESLAISALIAVTVGLIIKRLFRKNYDFSMKDGLFLAFFGWVVISAVSAIPFVLHGTIPSFTDAFFEMMSGYTTTGATIITDI